MNRVRSKDRGRFVAEVRRRQERRARHERDGDPSFWQSVGMMGAIGWSIALPTAAGLLFGRWLDGKLASQHVFLVFFMLVGLGVGSFSAWRLVKEKS